MSHSISPLHPTRFSVCFSVCFFVRWIILLLVATIAIDASAQSQRRKKKRSWKEKVEYADSIRLEIRRASDEGRLLQWGDSILRARRDSGSMDEKKYNALRKRLVKYDQLLHAGNAILAERYQRINYDTAYIMRPPGRWTIKLRGNLSGAWIRTTGRNGEDQYHTEVESDFRGTLSMAVAYRGLGAAVALNPMKLAGKSQDYELNVNSYSNRFGFDIVFLSSKTYHGKASMNDEVTPIEKGAIRQQALNVNLYYAFNSKRFSFPAAFSQSYLQRRSAGSFMVGASFDGQITDIDANETANQQPINLKLMEIGIGAGYGYNLVAGKRWLFHLSLLPTFDFYIHSRLKENGERINLHYRFPSLITTGRGAAVYFLAQPVCRRLLDLQLFRGGRPRSTAGAQKQMARALHLRFPLLTSEKAQAQGRTIIGFSRMRRQGCTYCSIQFHVPMLIWQLRISPRAGSQSTHYHSCNSGVVVNSGKRSIVCR